MQRLTSLGPILQNLCLLGTNVSIFNAIK